MKSLLQTCFFGLKEQRNMAALLGAISLLSLFMFLFYSSYDIMFEPGLNLVIMTIMALATAISLYQPALNNRIFWWATFGAIFSSFNVLYHPDAWSFAMFFGSFFLAVGSLQRKFNNILLAAMQWLVIQFTSPFYSIYFLVQPKNWKENSLQMLGKIAKLGIIPIFILVAFMGMYGVASEPFYDTFIAPALNLINLNSFDFGTIFVLFIGSFFIIPLMIPIQFKSLELSPLNEPKTIKRNREKVLSLFKMLDLSNELKIGTFTLIGLNVLVFLFNTLDLIHVWFGSTEMTASQLSQYVHEGTNMVILSITIGAGLLLVFFRKNLNFHPKNKTLKTLSYIWLAQNAFLALSTFTRNLHYVNEFGLTYKRLGVVIFIVGVLVGLFFIYQKIARKQTILHFFNRLLLAFFIILIGFSVIDHQRLIIQHAVYLQKDNVDLAYLANISYDHDFLLFRHMKTLNAKSHMKLNVYQSIDQSSNWRSFNLLEFKNAHLMKNLAINATYVKKLPETPKKKTTSKTLEPAKSVVITAEKVDLISEKEAFHNAIEQNVLQENSQKNQIIMDEPVPEVEQPR